MKLEEAIHCLKYMEQSLNFSDYEHEALRMAIGIMERLEDSVPGHPGVPYNGNVCYGQETQIHHP